MSTANTRASAPSMRPSDPAVLLKSGAASALVTAARSGDVEKLKKELAESGVNVNAPDSAGGRTALHWAMIASQRNVALLLLGNLARIDAEGKGCSSNLARYLWLSSVVFFYGGWPDRLCISNGFLVHPPGSGWILALLSGG